MLYFFTDCVSAVISLVKSCMHVQPPAQHVDSNAIIRLHVMQQFDYSVLREIYVRMLRIQEIQQQNRQIPWNALLLFD